MTTQPKKIRALRPFLFYSADLKGAPEMGVTGECLELLSFDGIYRTFIKREKGWPTRMKIPVSWLSDPRVFEAIEE